MNARSLSRRALFAALVASPLPAFAQNVASQPGSVNRNTDPMTLLTGPRLLSPPTRPLDSSRISSEIVQRGAAANDREEYPRRLQQQVEDAKARADAARAAMSPTRREPFQPPGSSLRLAPGQNDAIFSAPTTMPTPESLRFASPPAWTLGWPAAVPAKSSANPAATPLTPAAPVTPATPVTPAKPE